MDSLFFLTTSPSWYYICLLSVFNSLLCVDTALCTPQVVFKLTHSFFLTHLTTTVSLFQFSHISHPRIVSVSITQTINFDKTSVFLCCSNYPHTHTRTHARTHARTHTHAHTRPPCADTFAVRTNIDRCIRVTIQLNLFRAVCAV